MPWRAPGVSTFLNRILPFGPSKGTAQTTCPVWPFDQVGCFYVRPNPGTLAKGDRAGYHQDLATMRTVILRGSRADPNPLNMGTSRTVAALNESASGSAPMQFARVRVYRPPGSVHTA